MTSIAGTTATAITNGAATSVSSESLISSDFDTWLNLMTAQLQNQDPFDPVDSTAYTAQLAQFSSVEQQVKTNDLLSELISTTTSSDLATMAEWVGKEVKVAASATYDGTPMTIFTTSNPTAGSAELVVRDRYGSEVKRLPVSTGTDEVQWNGTDNSGKAVARESYSFEVENFNATGQSLGTNPAEIYAQVREVQRSGDQFLLILPDGKTVTAGDVSAVRIAEG